MNPPAFTPVQGRSFPRAVQVLATMAMAGLLASVWAARGELAGMALPPELTLLGGLAGLVVVWHYLHILFSTTGISGQALTQGWLWRSRVQLSDVAQVKLLRFKPLDGLVAPRLVVQTRGFGKHTFHAADPSVLAVIDVLVHGRAASPVEAGAGTHLDRTAP
ncbi:hypothetical protein ACVC7V_07970 [Hydrogenophaga sp. A37]|uniref:hypothetical protein n=1 Tax=Hydrogenophaga sp. A37 TaxID=1945864 RepID=UPI00098730ED|nr:hypothetical protein [Hydrogenophaga sp. A37]OOG82915.1 hypothetical protein B0E41_13830 [Hydrogenophaga sp. A37]